MSMSIQVKERTEQRKSQLKQLRDGGSIPAVIYGKKAGNKPVTVDEKELMSVLRRNPHAIVEVHTAKGGKMNALIHQVQKDKLSGAVIHVDFHQINMKQPIQTMVAVHVKGESSGVKEGGILQVESHELEIRCLPDQLPESLDADISGLGIGDNLLASEIKLPDKMELLSDPNTVVVTVLGVNKAAEIETPEPAAAEPAGESEEETESV